MLAKITIGWTWLERTLNTMIDAINAEKPLPSASIAVEESPNGTLLKVVGQQAQPGDAGAGGPAGGSWQLINIVDENCNRYTMYVWGTNPTLNN